MALIHRAFQLDVEISKNAYIELLFYVKLLLSHSFDKDFISSLVSWLVYGEHSINSMRINERIPVNILRLVHTYQAFKRASVQAIIWWRWSRTTILTKKRFFGDRSPSRIFHELTICNHQILMGQVNTETIDLRLYSIIKDTGSIEKSYCIQVLEHVNQ